MITFVMSTRQRDDAYMQKAIKTSGIKDVQFLCYENQGEYSLTELYNKGLEESTNDVVVFLHDDLDFESGSKWGQKLLDHFQNSDYGILGKAGTTELPETCMWWANPNEMMGRVHHEMIHPQTGKKLKWLSEYSGNYGKEIIPAVVVDGLLFAVHKKRIKAKFDESIKGFHLYEVDFCVANYLESVGIGVVFDFPLAHKSVGQTNDQWEANRKQVADKYKDKLPLAAPTKLIADNRPVNIKKQPLVSVIIPTKGKTDMVRNLLESIAYKSSYDSIEVVVVDTGSEEEDLTKLEGMVDIFNIHYTCRLVKYDYYNFAKINNDVVKNHLNPLSELLLFCNNDVVLINDCISLMVQTYLDNRHTCGTVGARLHFENNKIQHAGIFMKQLKDRPDPFVAGHVGYGGSYQYQNKTYTVLGNTAAFLLVKKSLFEKIGGFNETYSQCFEDVELNLQFLLRNHHNYLCGEAVAYHLESQTRQPGVQADDMTRLNEFVRANYEKLSKYILQPNKE